MIEHTPHAIQLYYIDQWFQMQNPYRVTDIKLHYVRDVTRITPLLYVDVHSEWFIECDYVVVLL